MRINFIENKALRGGVPFVVLRRKATQLSIKLNASRKLATDEWEEGQIPSSFYTRGQSPLMARASIAILRLHDFCLAGNKPPEKRGVFIIYDFYILRTKVALIHTLTLYNTNLQI